MQFSRFQSFAMYSAKALRRRSWKISRYLITYCLKIIEIACCMSKLYQAKSMSFFRDSVRQTSGYATMVHGRGCNPHRCTTTFANVEITSLWRHWWRHNSEIIRDRQKRRPACAMKSSELSNGENRIALRQLLQNRKLRHLWRQNFGSRWKLQKMAWENFSIGTLYNIIKNQHNPIKTVGRDSFLSPKTPKIQVFRGHLAPRGRTTPIF